MAILGNSQLSSQSVAQAVEHSESLEIVKALLHGSVSNFLRMTTIADGVL